MRNAEYLDKLNREESDLIPETDFESSRVKRKVSEKLQRRPKKRKYRALLIAAVLVCLFGAVTAAAEGAGDVQFAKFLGLSYVMESLDGGYMQINESCRSGGITVTVSKSIGDKYSQWIKVDTDIPWEAEENQYYIFSDFGFYVYRAPLTVRVENGRLEGAGQSLVRPCSGGSHLWAFENGGSVSFMIYAMDYDNLSSSIVEVSAEDITLYDEDGTEVKTYQGSFSFMWRNCYEENVRKAETGTVTAEDADGRKVRVNINKLEISPVSVRVLGRVNSKEYTQLEIDYCILKDGSRIEGPENTVSGHGTFGRAEWFFSLENQVRDGTVNGNDIDAVVINGKKFTVV